ncbi:unnamed protein product [Brassica napus]|uniref:(rape) hypothetical protein n=1 Tax=Brassica napus TaxID=3708 RepID=A0A816R2L8_BRANA|nr:unnamed protein product [Brassica napus]
MSRLLRSKQTCFHSPMNPKRLEDQNADDKDRRQDGNNNHYIWKVFPIAIIISSHLDIRDETRTSPSRGFKASNPIKQEAVTRTVLEEKTEARAVGVAKLFTAIKIGFLGERRSKP